MSTHRITSKAGWIDPGKLPRGPNGRALCRWCNHEVPQRRRTFCSDECVHQHKIRSSPGYLREQVFNRDRGVCALCGIDCDRIERVFRKLLRKAGLKTSHFPRFVDRYPDRYGALDMFRQEFPWFKPRLSAWAADHIVSVVEGGGECGLENLRTLCLNCHAVATAQLRERLKNQPRTPESSRPG